MAKDAGEDASAHKDANTFEVTSVRDDVSMDGRENEDVSEDEVTISGEDSNVDEATGMDEDWSAKESAGENLCKKEE